MEFEYAKSGLASSRKEKKPGLVKSVRFSGSEIPGNVTPGLASAGGDVLVEETVAGKARSCSSVGRVEVGAETRPE